MTADLPARLERAITAAEDAARGAHHDPIGAMSRAFEADARRLRADITSGRSASERQEQYDQGQTDALHWVSTVLPERMKPLTLHDPAAVLRRCAADRKQLKLHAQCVDRHPMDLSLEPVPHCDTCGAAGYPCDSILALAEGYGLTAECICQTWAGLTVEHKRGCPCYGLTEEPE